MRYPRFHTRLGGPKNDCLVTDEIDIANITDIWFKNAGITIGDQSVKECDDVDERS
jgi:hypothetical protein